MAGANAGIVLSGLDAEWNDFHERGTKNFQHPGCRFLTTRLVWTDERLADGKCAGAKLISPLFHFQQQLSDNFGITRVVLNPVDEQHCVPINSAHRLCGTPSASRFAMARENSARSRRRNASPPPREAKISFPIPLSARKASRPAGFLLSSTIS